MRLRGLAAAPGAAVGPVWICRAPARDRTGPVPASIGPRCGRRDRGRSAGVVGPRAPRRRAARRGGHPRRPGDDGDATRRCSTRPAGSSPADRRRARPSDCRARPSRAGSRPSTTSCSRPVPPTSATSRPASRGRSRVDVLELPVVPSIALADDLPPSVTAEIPAGLLLGIAPASPARRPRMRPSSPGRSGSRPSSGWPSWRRCRSRRPRPLPRRWPSTAPPASC